MARSSILALVLLTTGCSSYWGRRPIDEPIPLKPWLPVWIWSRGAVNKWREVVITQDSVSGIPYNVPKGCYSMCLRSLPRSQVDSMKLGYRTTAENVTLVVGAVTAAIIVEAAVCSVVAPRNGEC